MKVVVLCGGMGTRLREETEYRPKPMVEIGGKPILWHIMNIYRSFGYKEFTLALGYKGEMIKEYFINYYHHQSNLNIDLKTGKITAENNNIKDWKIDLVDTGEKSMTGGRLGRLEGKLNETFMLTYGDGLSDVDIEKLVEFHKSHGKIATVTAVRPSARFGCMSFDGEKVVDFKEKSQTGEGWVNGGFFVFQPEIFKYLKSDKTILEQDPLENLAKDGQLMVHKHEGFWHCMDTIRDRNVLEGLWQEGIAPWKK
ncbi:MAG: glucose-1-phosphate cytidylyltransferase [Candidatus Omnitrophica bacterium]|nr:glucose-1-phosphate cytidylyltransferase [Candidatus Omnitrophota bacterium]